MGDEFPPIDFSDATFESTGEEKTGDTTTEAAPKRTRRQRSDAGVPRGPRSSSGSSAPRKSSTNSARLVAELTDPIAKIAMGMAFQSPTAAAVLITRGENTAQAMV